MTVPAPLQPLAAALDRLAASAHDQVTYLSALGAADLVDELALEFDDLYAPRATQLEEVSPDSAAACRELDSMLSSDRIGWRFADLESTQWAAIRAMAAAALSALVRDSGGDRS